MMKNELDRQKVKNILIGILIFIIGFGTGMLFAFGTVFRMLSTHNIDVSLWK